MNFLDHILPALQCPHCGAPLEGNEQAVHCTKEDRHTFVVKDDFFTFGEPPLGKYEATYAKKYAFLWAYGYETRHSGLNESLYRTVAALAAESLTKVASPFIVDAGCGVGRSTADCAVLFPEGKILGLDGSPEMLRYARKIVCGNEPIKESLEEFGFVTEDDSNKYDTVRVVRPIEPRKAPNVFLARADVENLPLKDGCADLILSINIIDRLEDGLKKALKECYRILKPGGWLVFTDPLNWTKAHHWKESGKAEDVIRFMENECEFDIKTWFDDLLYHEILDGRGSLEIFRTIVVKAQKPA